MIDFPNNPTVGQQFTSAGVTWTWDGFKWTATGLNVAYLPLAGGTMLGPLTLQANPAGNLDAAPKQYVDALSMGYPLGNNRIINGDMRIDQRNNGASGTAINVYTVDRWQYLGSTTPLITWQQLPVSGFGFGYCLSATTTTVHVPGATQSYYFQQAIEADFVTDFQWGTPNAQPVTLSFWAQSSMTGQLSGAIANDAGTRSYPFNIPLPTANTWTKVSITIPGDTGGPWVTSGNAKSVIVIFDLGSGGNFRGPANAWAAGNFVGVTGSLRITGTASATFSVTGVKLEIGSVATPYNRQSLAKSMADCQRYYQQPDWQLITSGWNTAGLAVNNSFYFPITMRAAPTITPSAITYVNASGLAFPQIGAYGSRVNFIITAAGYGYAAYNLAISAEL